MNTSKTFNRIATSVIVSIAVGAVIAMIMSPKKMREMSKKISNKKDKMTKSLKDNFETLMASHHEDKDVAAERELAKSDGLHI
jgi:gas vesicle protein